MEQQVIEAQQDLTAADLAEIDRAFPRPSLFDQALAAAIPNTLRPAANTRAVLFSLYGGGVVAVDKGYLTTEQALAKFASDGDVRAFIASARPEQWRKLDTFRSLHCHDAEEVQAQAKARADYEEALAEHRAKYYPNGAPDNVSPPASEYGLWAAGKRVPGYL